MKQTMLKIKEDKAQELEKLGFRKCKCTGGYVYFYDIYKIMLVWGPKLL